MKKAVDPVMAAYAKEIDAEEIYKKINIDVSPDSRCGPARRHRLRRTFRCPLWANGHARTDATAATSCYARCSALLAISFASSSSR